MSPRLSDLLLGTQSDERLVSLARAGQDRAFAAIVQRYRPELFALARRLTSDGRAEDLLQQAFLSAFAALRSGAEVQHLRAWLYQIVRNAATKAKPTAELALDQVDVAGEPLEATVLRRARALDAMSELARLPERQRGALVATALGDRAHAEVAASMGISEQAVRQLVHRARATLRGAVTGITPWPLANWLTTAPNAANAPEVAVGAGAVSSTGAAVKLVALLAATGALATGAAVVPLRQVHRGNAGRSPVTHTRGAPARAVPRAARFDSLVAVAPALGATRRVPESRSTGHDARTGRSPGSPGISHEHRLATVKPANIERAVEDPVPDRRGGTAPGGHPGTARSEGGPGAAGTPSGGSGSGDLGGQRETGSSGRAGSDSEGSGPGSAGGANLTVGESGGNGLTSHGDSSSVSDNGDGGAPTASNSSATGTGSIGDEPDGDTSNSIEGGGSHSGSGSDGSISDAPRERG
jgi:RNA polymerase sigma factor (sigma-70 family)